MTLQELWKELVSKSTLAGALLGIIISIVIWLTNRFIKFIENCNNYGKYSGNYICYLKNKPTVEHYRLNLKRHSNKFTVSGNSQLQNKDLIKGQIEMSTSLKNYGTGYYYHHVKGEKHRFGFYQIQLIKDNILVHQEIKNLKKDKDGKTVDIGEDCSAAYVWVKQKK